MLNLEMREQSQEVENTGELKNDQDSKQTHLLQRVEDGKAQIEALKDELKLAENEILKQKIASRDVDDKR